MHIMYNLNVSGSGGASNLLSLPQGEASCTTPRTPEILNSLIAMTNPFDSYRGNSAPRLASSPPGGSDTTSTSSSGSPGCMSPPSVQHTCSQLIKEGLKLTIQTKRRQTGRVATTTTTTNANASASHLDDWSKAAKKDEVSGDSLGDDDDCGLFSPGVGLTPEDEERRRRRRERNKIAATKCRLKKRERTVNLVQESEILENQNHDLKSQIQELETQRRRLVDMLSVHRPSCTKHRFANHDNSAFPSNANNFHHDIRCTSAVTMETNTTMYRRVNMSNFSRPSSTSSVDTAVAYRRLDLSESSTFQRPESTTGVEPSYQRMETVESNNTYCRPPSGPAVESTTTNIYHTFDEDVIKDPTVMLPYCRTPSGSSIDSSPQFMKLNSDMYNCQPELTNLDSSMTTYMKSDTSPNYQRSPSSFSHPVSLDINTPVSPDYDNNVGVLDSPNVAPNNYQHFDEDHKHNYSAGFASTNLDRGCIA